MILRRHKLNTEWHSFYCQYEDDFTYRIQIHVYEDKQFAHLIVEKTKSSTFPLERWDIEDSSSYYTGTYESITTIAIERVKEFLNE